jgi:phage terminase small subunit
VKINKNLDKLIILNYGWRTLLILFMDYMTKKKSKLNIKQAAFVQEYLVDLNATQAAIRAGYSKKTARSCGQRLLTHADIQVFLALAQGKRQARTEISQDTVLKNIVRIGDKAEDAERYSDALKAQEMLAKHVKLFSDSDSGDKDPPPTVNVYVEVAPNA